MAMDYAFEHCQHSPTTEEDACSREEHDLYFRLTCYKSFIPLGVKDSSLRLYICHHKRGKGRKRDCCLPWAMSEWIDGCTRQQRGGGSHH